ncbi:MAG TPA: hypothetical protein VGG19_12940 [Tepidisphaeraceae bacterium]|jgi:hypothetical protein
MNNTLKDELLNQNGHAVTDSDVSLLHTVIAAEENRFRKLLFWTICTWILWVLILPFIFIGPAMLASPHLDIAPSATILGLVLFIACIVGLPIAGIILAIMLIMTRRSAGLHQLRVALAVIEARLRLMSSNQANGDK